MRAICIPVPLIRVGPAWYNVGVYYPKMAAESSPDSTNSVNPLTPVHNPSLNKFVLACGGGEEAFLSYNIEDNSVWDAYHTEVPISQRGKGLGGILAEV